MSDPTEEEVERVAVIFSAVSNYCGHPVGSPVEPFGKSIECSQCVRIARDVDAALSPPPATPSEGAGDVRWVIENCYADPPCYVRVKAAEEWLAERRRDYPKRVAEHVVQEWPSWWTFDTDINKALQLVRSEDAQAAMRGLGLKAPDNWVRPMEHAWPTALSAMSPEANNKETGNG